MVKITVAMAAYNHEKYIGAAIKSVLAQEDSDFELIIVDDGSSDGTVAEIKKFTDPRLRFIAFERNLGPCTALNTAIEHGSGKYIAILNSDDCFLPGKIKKQADFLDSHPSIGAVFSRTSCIDEEGKLLDQKGYYGEIFNQHNQSRHEWLNHLFFHGNCLCHPTVLMRKTCHEKVGYYDVRSFKLYDYDLWIRLLLHYEIHILEEELTQFRVMATYDNASAPTLKNFYRLQWEHSHVLNHYHAISTIEEYLKIFPSELTHVKVHDHDLIPFYLANLSLRYQGKKQDIYRVFGIETLFSLLGKKEIREKLEAKCNYYSSDFLRSTEVFPLSYLNSPPLLKRMRKCLSFTWVWNNRKRLFTHLKNWRLFF